MEEKVNKAHVIWMIIVSVVVLAAEIAWIEIDARQRKEA